MKTIASLILLIYLQLNSSYSIAMWTKFSDMELCSQSEMIVQAKMIGYTYINFSEQKSSLKVGVLLVEENLKNENIVQSIVLISLPSSEKPIASTDIIYHTGQSGLWFLRSDRLDGIELYFADHPQRFIPIEKVPARIDIFRQILQSD